MPTVPRRPAAQRERDRLQARRLRAAELFGAGVTQAEVARQLEVSAQAVSVWHARWRQGGTDALRSRGPSGPAPRLSDAQLDKVEQALLDGAAANGFVGELWTLDRIAVVIERLTGVQHHPAHVWALLRHRLGWSVQRPVRRAAERDQDAIDRWVKQRWPAIKALLVGAPEELRAELRSLPTRRQIAVCAALRDRPTRSLEHQMTVRVLRSTARRIQALQAEAEELHGQLQRLTAAIAPWLLELFGVGPVSAAQLLVSWSHAGRFRSEAAFAALAGASPIPASSGKVTRHRLNRGGDRQLNQALHTIALVRLRDDLETRAYATRRTTEGKSPRDVKRCLKRIIARQLFRLLECYDQPGVEVLMAA